MDPVVGSAFGTLNAYNRGISDYICPGALKISRHCLDSGMCVGVSWGRSGETIFTIKNSHLAGDLLGAIRNDFYLSAQTTYPSR